MWFEKKVGRKEFEDYKYAVKTQLDQIREYSSNQEIKIYKLEAANNCRDGKHEWENVSNINYEGIKPDLFCKHCTIKKDEWEKNKPTSDLAQAIAGGHGYGRPYIKPQPKRKMPNAETLAGMREIEEGHTEEVTLAQLRKEFNPFTKKQNKRKKGKK